MKSMPSHVRSAYINEMTAARQADDDPQRWAHLERAHIISQPYPWPHTRNHIAMLALALRQRDRREALGQIVRIIVAAPGSLSGRYPEGNTGRVDAGLMTPMPVSEDLADMLRG
ncbi:DUF3703 domain-containing protein [Rhodococcus ruber]|uniref:DUF3703 domain-containing protein n=1 Tax=Rhodococcus ruber TaxID=1830 RepID=A0A098BP74_9NOCA|nr:DUF3703 domain-containing protein [Rhodococcus ruber]MCD2127235.1 DUF3703 domain-containing protein [Rhodococcus ruber]MCZ4503168.1 DUF3703 domain-containing protein [Rhodococcus ruber]MCZ4530737.1 DUF3703 domain-containing protein [Rhodococcus ruber]MCZ4621563.1 DUF3703 domain-containing protein [Rhodococcus ruber]MDI9969447.1 DUF3703 domain-containing protein [Rhodococcus ruber]